MSKSPATSRSTSPRKFSEKIALLNRKEEESNAEFEKIIKEVEATTRLPQSDITHHGNQRVLNNYRYHSSRTFAFDQQDEEYPIYPNSKTQFYQQPSGYINNATISNSSSFSNNQTSHNNLVPNINILPIYDDEYRSDPHQYSHTNQQQVFNEDSNNHYTNYSNSISSTRSLPDIVSASESRLMSPHHQIAPSHSDYALANPDFDIFISNGNANQISNGHIRTTMNDFNSAGYHRHYQQDNRFSQQSNPNINTSGDDYRLMQATSNNNHDGTSQYHRDHSLINQPQHLHQQRSLDANFMESDNSWCNGNTLVTPKLNNLSKSLDNCNECSCCNRMRSNSFNVR